MYPITELRPDFTFKHEGDNIKKQRFVSPSISIDISYPMGEKIVAIVKLILTITCTYEDTKTKVVATANNIYSITKNDDLELVSNSDTVYYCAKMLERSLQLHLREIAKDPLMPNISLPLISYEEWMNGKGRNTIQFSAN